MKKSVTVLLLFICLLAAYSLLWEKISFRKEDPPQEETVNLKKTQPFTEEWTERDERRYRKYRTTGEEFDAEVPRRNAIR